VPKSEDNQRACIWVCSSFVCK